MTVLKVFVFAELTLRELKKSILSLPFTFREIGKPKAHAEGEEQGWECCDAKGPIFSFTIVVLNEANAFQLKPGTVCIVFGPNSRGRKNKDILEARRYFEYQMPELGGRLFTG